MNVWPYIIAISGPSCSGKSKAAKLLAEAVPGLDAAILPMDAYYRDLSHLEVSERARWNFDAPDAIDDALYVDHLRGLIRGEAISRPVYDYTTHARRPDSEQVGPARLIITEGLLAFHWETARVCADIRVFLDTPDDVCLARRIHRDVRHRGRTEQSVREQYAATVRPMYEQYGKPTMQYADLVIDGTRPVEEIVAEILPRTGIVTPGA